MQTALEFALEYATRHGCYVFPIHAGHKGGTGKYHVASWAEESSNDPKKIQAWGIRHPGCNWGLDCGKSDLTVIDVDNKPGQQGWLHWQKVLAEEGQQEPPWTRTHVTPGKGRHYLFRGALRARKNLATNIDIKSTGGYVVLPGSQVGDRIYGVIETAPIQPLPDWLKKRCEPKKAEPLDLGLKAGDLDRPHHVSEAIKYLRETEPAIEGAGGNNRTYEVAVQVKDLGLTQQAALEVMLEHFNDRCQPPWSAEDLARIVRNAYQYGQNPPGSKTPEARLATAKEEFTKVDAPSSWPIPVDSDEFALGAAPPREWLIPNWLPKQEVNSIYGAGAAGKSLVLLQLAMSLTSGKPWLGLPVTQQCRFLAICCEDSKDEIHRRLDAIRIAYEYEGATGKGFLVWPRVGLDTTLVMQNGFDIIPGPFLSELKAYLRTLDARIHTMIAADTISDIYMGDENAREKANKVVKVYLARLMYEFNCTITFVAHPSRVGMNTGDMLSGSTAWENAVRNRLALSKSKDNEQITLLERKKSNYARAGEAIPIIYDTGRFRPAVPGEAMPVAEALDLSQWVGSRFETGAVMPVTDMVDRIANDPAIAQVLAGLTSIKRRTAKLVDLLRAGVGTDRIKVQYEYRPDDRVKHWLRIANRHEPDWTE